MKELHTIVSAFEQAVEMNKKIALATVVKVIGSAYRRPGARMLVTEDGQFVGAISGGCLEGDALRKARKAMQKNVPVVVTYNTMDDTQATPGIGLGCNGIIEVLIEPLDGSQPNPIDKLRQRLHCEDVAVLATVIRTEGHILAGIADHVLLQQDGKLLIDGLKDHELALHIFNDARLLFTQGESSARIYQLRTGRAEVFLEKITPAFRLVLVGAGHDAVPVMRLSKELGWHVTVADHCIAHLVPKKFALADRLMRLEAGQVDFPVNAYTAVVLMSHNYQYDLAMLRALWSASLPYVGILGPKKRTLKMLDALSAEGFQTDPLPAFLHSPVGLDIGAETPDEIALSIVAEIQAVMKQRNGGLLKHRKGTIHEQLKAE